MRFARCLTDSGFQAGLVEDGRFVPLEGAGDISSLFARFGTDFAALARSLQEVTGAPVELSSLKLAPPLQRPGKIIGIGRNYGEHAREGGLERQEKPRLFLKPASAISGPGAVVERPPSVRKLDFEGELVAVIGRRARRESIETAASAIGGYTVGNDLSAREFQFDVKPPQTSFAKGMDGFAAIGPWIVTADELGSAPDLRITTHLNGETMQDDRTGNLIFPVTECIAHISQYMTLEAGDLVFTGTPAGVGYFRDPQVFLEPGDMIRVEIEGIGTLETRIG